MSCPIHFVVPAPSLRLAEQQGASLCCRAVQDATWSYVESHYDISPHAQLAALQDILRSNTNRWIHVAPRGVELSSASVSLVAELERDRSVGCYLPTTIQPAGISWETPPSLDALSGVLPLNANPLLALAPFIIDRELLIGWVTKGLAVPHQSCEAYAKWFYDKALSSSLRESAASEGIVSIIVPMQGESITRKAEELYREGRYEAALELLDSVVHARNAMVTADKLRAYTLARLQKFPEAHQAARRYLYQVPTDAECVRFYYYVDLLKTCERPVVSVARVRHNALYADDAAPLRCSIRDSSYASAIQLAPLEVAVGPDESPAQYLERLSGCLEGSHGRYFCLSYDFASYAPSTIAHAVERLEQHPELDGIALSVARSNETILDMSSRRVAEIFPLNENGLSLLASLVMRTDFARTLLLSLRPEDYRSSAELALHLYSVIRGTKIRLERGAPEHPVMIEPFPTPDAVMDEAVALINDHQYQGALDHLDQLLCYESLPASNLDYLRAVCLVGLNRPAPAALVLKRQLATQPKYEKARALLEVIPPRMQSPQQCSFEEFSEAFASVAGAFSHGEAKLLFDAVRKLPDDATIVEVGSGWGRSSTALAFACSGTRRKLYCIDIFKDGDLEFSLDLFHRNIKRFGVEDQVVTLRGHSHRILEQWGDKPKVDLAFIDACHTYEFVHGDYTRIYPLVKPHGFIALHDTVPCWSGSWFVWMSQARHDLYDHQYEGSLACGYKIPGRCAPIDPGEIMPHELIPEWASGQADSLTANTALPLHAMMTAPPGSALHRAAERNFMSLPSESRAYLRQMTEWYQSHLTLDDGMLHYWTALSHLADGDALRAFASFSRALAAKRPVEEERVAPLLRALADVSSCNRSAI